MVVVSGSRGGSNNENTQNTFCKYSVHYPDSNISECMTQEEFDVYSKEHYATPEQIRNMEIFFAISILLIIVYFFVIKPIKDRNN